MDDAGLVRRGERVGDLRGEVDRLLKRQPALRVSASNGRPSISSITT